MGMTRWQVLRQVEVPSALPLIISGLRSAVLQVIATATIAAFVGLGGLGRYLIDGLALGDYPQMAGGALLVAVLAVVLDGGARPGAASASVSPGLTGRAVSVVAGRIHAASRLRPTGLRRTPRTPVAPA